MFYDGLLRAIYSTYFMPLTRIFSVFLLGILLIGVVGISRAQEALPAIAIAIPALADSIEEGSIICTYGDGFIPCNSPYAENIFGVVTTEPLIEIADSGLENPISVVQDGQVNLRVSTSNGIIFRGDRLTTSNTPGVAQKALKNGPILGFARQDFAPEDATEIGTIVASIDFEGRGYGFGEISSQLDSVPTFLRALIAGAVAIITIILSFMSFKRATQSGIEAIGRNPLAKGSIQVSLITNYAITAVFAFLGLVAAYIIVVL